MKETRKMNFLVLLLLFGILPVVIALVISTNISINKMTNSLEDGVYNKLDVAALALAEYYEYDIYHGILEYEENYVDSMKGMDIELTVFQDDTRFMTSIYKDNSNERNIGTKADSEIYSSVKSGNIVTKDHVMIGGEQYYVSYRPMYDENGDFWGMAFAGTPERFVISEVNNARNALVSSAIVIVVISSIVIFIVATRIKKPMIKAVDVLTVLSKGDIHTEINETSFILELDNILKASSNLRISLCNAIDSVRNSSSNMNISVDEVHSKTDENSHSVSQINEAINEVALTSQSVSTSAMELSGKALELENHVDKLMNNVDTLNKSSDLIKNANKEASEYMDIVLKSSNESVVAVNSIVEEIENTHKAISNINKVLEMLQGISDETKLLSLNASIEAAHAGELGKGFAVVASEIKQLADSSSSNVDKISSIIEEITTLSDNSVKDAEKVTDTIKQEQQYIAETQSKFNILSSSVDDSILEINSISEKTDSLREIQKNLVDATSYLGAISQELGASAEEVSATCSTVASSCELTLEKTVEMRGINNKLTEAVSFFK